MDKESMHIQFMKEAIKQAKKAAAIGEVPIGAVIVRNGQIISRGYNRRETKKNALLHAEITAIDRACKKLGGWRLPGCEIYITLEPCPMCSGAIINSRIEKVYFGAYDPKAGCAGSKTNLFDSGLFNHKPDIIGGILETECAQLLKSFFENLRYMNKLKRINNQY